jgi:heptose I phosphotransferase
MILHLDAELQSAWAGKDVFDVVRNISGTVYRDKEGRRTLRFEQNGAAYFLKLHQGIGWGEVFKNLVTLRLPVVGARNEWLAINRLHALGVDTLDAVGYGQRGLNPATQLSFLITRELTDTISLEDLCARWPQQPPPFALKLALIREVARIAKKIHDNGINHRDFYLCHFLVDVHNGMDQLRPNDLRLFLVDLHRAQLRAAAPLRWVVKDIGGLYFSAHDIGLTRRDVLRFMRCYRGTTLRETLDRDADFWRQCKARARQIYVRYLKREPHFPI